MSTKTSALFAIRRAAAALLLLVGSASVAGAHHSIAGQFDMTKAVRITGVVTKLEWVNPHVYVFLDAHDAHSGNVVWKLETLPVAMLRKAGIKKQMLMTGETVVLDICPARNGTARLGFILNLQFPDGRRFQFSRDPSGGAVLAP